MTGAGASKPAILVIGAGMAGASVAAQLAERAQVTVIERESQPGYHSTGRSAALFSEIYGGPVIRALSRASRGFLFDPPAGFADGPLVRPRGALYAAAQDATAHFDAWRSAPDVAAGTREISTAEARRLVPILAPGSAVRAALEPTAMDLEVHALHQGYLRLLRQRGGRVVVNAELTALQRRGAQWHASTAAGEFRADCIVNAAGAWADVVAALAGVAPIGLEPRRRTAVLIDAPTGVGPIDAWPIVIDAAEAFYFKPDAGRLLLSPADETPSPPCDAQPDEYDVALAIDRFERATGLAVGRVTHRWAGLRSFVPDRAPVAGFERDAPGFFWLAAQGGYGIQTAPALARCAAALLLGDELPADVRAAGITAAALERYRFPN